LSWRASCPLFRGNLKNGPEVYHQTQVNGELCDPQCTGRPCEFGRMQQGWESWGQDELKTNLKIYSPTLKQTGRKERTLTHGSAKPGVSGIKNRAPNLVLHAYSIGTWGQFNVRSDWNVM